MTITIEHRDSRTWPMWFTQHLLGLFSPEFICCGADKMAGIKPVKGSPKLTPPKLKGCIVEARTAGNLNVYTIKRAIPDETLTKKNVIFFPGGACKAQAGPFHWQFCASLVKEVSNCTVTLISYPLTPENTASSCHHDIRAACQILLKEAHEQGELAIYAGDSAGGGLALTVPLASLAADAAALCPSSVLLVSPGVDLRMKNPRCAEVDKIDPLLTLDFCNEAIKEWAGDWSLDDPKVTPMVADFTPFIKRGVKLYGVLGTWDVLYPDGELLVEKLKDSLTGKFLVWDKQMHDFPLMFSLGLSESKAAFEWIVRAVREM